MEVALQTTPPHLSAPSSPKRFADLYSYFSAPTSPTRMSEFYADFENCPVSSSGNAASVPVEREEKPGTSKPGSKFDDDFAFEFDFRADLEKNSRTAEELFDGGKIRAAKPPPGFKLIDGDGNLNHRIPIPPTKSTRSARNFIRELFSPKRMNRERIPTDNERGRERASSNPRRATRSLSPYRVSAHPWEEQEKQPQQQNSNDSLSSSSKSSRRWRLKDLLLFRSTSEGHANDKDQFKKNSGGKGRISPHEFYYTANKEAQKDLKKKTFLPYKHSIWGRLARH